MQKALFGVLAAIVILGSFGYFRTAHKEAGVSLPAHTVAVKQEEPILLYVESGEVLYKVSADADLIEATTSPISIPNKTTIHTNNGKASVLLPSNSSFSIGANTEITVNYTKKSTSIYQAFGNTYHRVEALLSGQMYEVQTPGTLAAVRGTRFAVVYNPNSKKTKVSVTEHIVHVKRIRMESETVDASTTEELSIPEGKTVTVNIAALTTTKPTIIDTSKDTESALWIKENKNKDAVLDTIKKDSGNDKERLRKAIRKGVFDDDPDNPTIKIVPGVSQTKSGTVDAAILKTKTTVNKITTVPAVLKKDDLASLTDEAYFSKFENTFIANFYVDDADAICKLTSTPEERVALVKDLSTRGGRPFTRNTDLLPFAQNVVRYCGNKDISTKKRLQDLFDDMYPYRDL